MVASCTVLYIEGGGGKGIYNNSNLCHVCVVWCLPCDYIHHSSQWKHDMMDTEDERVSE